MLCILWLVRLFFCIFTPEYKFEKHDSCIFERVVSSQFLPPCQCAGLPTRIVSMFTGKTLGRHGAHYDLIPCAAGRQPVDMTHICMTICSKVPGCIGIEYDEFYSGLHHCHLHGERGDTRLSNSVLGVQWPKCAHAP